MMRLMNLHNSDRRLAVSPAHVRYIERERDDLDGRDRDHVKVYLVDEAIPLRVSGTFDEIVKEWQDALEGRPYTPPRRTNEEDLRVKGPGGIFEGGLVEDDDIVDEQDEPTPAYGSRRFSE